jgi:hypothetical protein
MLIYEVARTDGKMPIISLWLPWAAWVVLGWKTIETRKHTRFKKLKGFRIGIHAANKWDKTALPAAYNYLTNEQIELTRTGLFMHLPLGGKLIGSVLVKEEGMLNANHSAGALFDLGAVDKPRHGLFLTDPKKLVTPIPMKGFQGLWYAKVQGE